MKIHFVDPPDPQVSFFLGGNFEESSLKEADFIFHHNLVRAKSKKILKELSEKNSQSGKMTIVLLIDDFEFPYKDYSNLLLLRFSARKSKLGENEIVVPYLFECKDQPFAPCQISSGISIGFCGKVEFRKKIISVFEKEPGIQTDFIKRKSFWGGKPHSASVVEDFYGNMKRNPFNLTTRGAGNFYNEVLSSTGSWKNSSTRGYRCSISLGGPY